MTDETETDEQAVFAQSLAFNAEAARSGLFAAAQDIAKTMRENGVPHGEAALLTGAIEMAAQLYTQVMLAAGHTPRAIRTELHKQVRFFHRKHLKAEREGAPEVTRQ